MQFPSSDTMELLGGGVAFTVGLTVITTLSSLGFGLLIGSARLSDHPVMRRVAGAYIEVFRNVPALIQIIFWAFAIPNLVPGSFRADLFFNNAVTDAASALTGLAIPYYGLAACAGLTLNTSAYLAELLRSGAATVPTQRTEVARILGASRRTVMRTIVIPDSVRAVFPAISNRLVHNMKNTALASFVAVPELFHEMQASITKTFRATELLLLAAIMYLLLAALMSVILGEVDRRLQRGRLQRGRLQRSRLVSDG